MRRGVFLRGVTQQGETGAISLEFVMLAPVVIGLMLFAAFAGTVGMNHIKVTRAVHDAARAATQVQTSAEADQLVADTLRVSLGQKQFEKCSITTLDTAAVGESSSGGVDIGNVRVSIFCTMDISAFTWVTKKAPTFQATAIEPVDIFRSRIVIPG